MRTLRPGGRLQFADIATGKTVPEAAVRNIDCGPTELPVACRRRLTAVVESKWLWQRRYRPTG
jgi:hypothetical protein